MHPTGGHGPRRVETDRPDLPNWALPPLRRRVVRTRRHCPSAKLATAARPPSSPRHRPSAKAPLMRPCGGCMDAASTKTTREASLQVPKRNQGDCPGSSPRVRPLGGGFLTALDRGLGDLAARVPTWRVHAPDAGRCKLRTVQSSRATPTVPAALSAFTDALPVHSHPEYPEPRLGNRRVEDIGSIVRDDLAARAPGNWTDRLSSGRPRSPRRRPRRAGTTGR